MTSKPKTWIYKGTVLDCTIISLLSHVFSGHLPALNLPILDAGILIMVQPISLMEHYSFCPPNFFVLTRRF